jgi:hypothetical protein
MLGWRVPWAEVANRGVGDDEEDVAHAVSEDLIVFLRYSALE